MLTAADESWNNSISYHQMMKSDESVGRYPDGSNHVYLMNLPTIAKANILSSYAVNLSSDPSGINEMTLTNTANISMNYARDRLIISSDLSIPAAKLGIYNITGQLLSQQTVSLANGYAEQNLDALSSGCYIARLSDGNGHQATCKFIKK